MCQKYNYYINITTNGSLLLENVGAIINNPKIRQINISLHALEAVANKEKYLEKKSKLTNVDNIMNELLNNLEIKRAAFCCLFSLILSRASFPERDNTILLIILIS